MMGHHVARFRKINKLKYEKKKSTFMNDAEIEIHLHSL